MTQAIQMPRPCRYCDVKMIRMENPDGIVCPTCGHREFDIMYTATTDEGGVPIPPPDCHCFNCFRERTKPKAG